MGRADCLVGALGEGLKSGLSYGRKNRIGNKSENGYSPKNSDKNAKKDTDRIRLRFRTSARSGCPVGDPFSEVEDCAITLAKGQLDIRGGPLKLSAAISCVVCVPVAAEACVLVFSDGKTLRLQASPEDITGLHQAMVAGAREV